MEKLVGEIEAYGFKLSEEGIKLLQTESLKTKAQAIQFLLDHNIKEYGREQLSSSLNTATTVLKGQFLLQVVSVNNVTAPSINQSSNLFPRMLRLRLTDGVSTIVGIEYELIQQISLSTAPGTKVLLTNPDFFNGTLLLRPSSIRVLGGVVSDLYELWKAQEVMAMKNRHRSNLRNKDIHPPKFVSFEEYVKQKKRVDSRTEKASSTSKTGNTSTSTSTTAGKQLDIKAIEDLDLHSIENKRKEVLGDLVSGNVKELAKWGTTQQMEKKEDIRRNPRERHDRHNRSQSTTKTLSMAMATATSATAAVPTVHSSPSSTTTATTTPANATATVRVYGGESKPTAREPTVSVTKQAKIADMTVLESTKDLTFLLTEGKSLLTLSAGKRLYAYLVDEPYDSIAFSGIKDSLVGMEYIFGIGNENGSEKILTIAGEDDVMIPPADFVVSPENSSSSSSSSVTRAFFRKSGPRGTGRRESTRGNGRGRGGSHPSHTTTTASQPKAIQQSVAPRGNRQIKSTPSVNPSTPVHHGGNHALSSSSSSSQVKSSRGGMAGSASGRGGHQGSISRGGGSSGNRGRGGNHTIVNTNRGGTQGRGRGRGRG